MSTVVWIVGGVFILFIGVIIFNFFRMKNMKPAKDSTNVKRLNKKNYNTYTKNGLVLIDFWAAWCAPCKMIAPILNEIAEKESSIVTIAKVNVEYEKSLAAKFKVRNIPTMVLLKDGKEVKRFVGVKTKKFLMKEINAFA